MVTEPQRERVRNNEPTNLFVPVFLRIIFLMNGLYIIDYYFSIL